MRKCKFSLPAAPGWRIAPNPLARLSVAAVFTLAMLAASEILASCGDYVHVAGAMIPDGITHDADAGLNDLTSAGRSTSPVVPAAPACHGPNCHRQLPQPSDSAPPVLVSGGHQWACWITAGHQFDAESATTAFDFSFHPLAGHRRAIDRPPRAT